MIKFLEETKFLIALFLLFTAATIFSYLDLNVEKVVTARSPEEILKATRVENSLASLLPEFQRNPAAVEVKKSDMLKADVFCQRREKARFKKVSQSLVMLNLNVCEELKSTRHIWIKNATNGFKAQIFKKSEKIFRTDFIQLSAGSNKLTIEAVLKDGQKRVQSLEIISGS